MKTTTSNLKLLKSGERPPRGSGNMAIVRRCATEILALQMSKLDFDRLAICQLLSDAFEHPKGQITPQRLSNYLSAVLKKDSPEEKKERDIQVQKLKGDIEQIKANLRIRAANYRKESLWSNVRTQATAPVSQSATRSVVSTQQAIAPSAPAKPDVAASGSDGVNEVWAKLSRLIKSKGHHTQEKNIPKILSVIETNYELFRDMWPIDLYIHPALASLIK